MTRRAIVFGSIGVLVNVIYAGLFFGILWAAPEQRLLASTFAFSMACGFQYVANSHLTFGKSSRSMKQLGRYIATIAVGLVSSSIFLTWVSPWLGLIDLAAMLIVMVSLPVLNFALFSLWVFAGDAEADTRYPTSKGVADG